MDRRFHPQYTWATRYRVHRVGRIPTKFMTTCCNWPLWPRTKGSGLVSRDWTRIPCVFIYKPKDILNHIIEVDSRFYLAVLLEHCSNASDYLTRTVAVTDDILHCTYAFHRDGAAFASQRKPAFALVTMPASGCSIVGD